MTVVHVTVVAQTPPPVGGQAVMLQLMLEGRYTDVRLHHVRMNFSKQLSARGAFRWGKGVELLRVVAAVWASRIRHRSTILYYPPSGPMRLPVLRDTVILLLTRWAFKRTIWHFHASGVADYVRTLPPLSRAVVRFAMRRPSAAVRISESAPDEGAALDAGLVFVVPNGIGGIDRRARARDGASPPQILFVGLVGPGKGAMRVLEVAAALRRRRIPFLLRIAGEFESPEFETAMRRFIADHDLADAVRLEGVVVGAAKEALFADADVFLFLTRFESETFPTVVLEAMSAEVPVVASDWRGIPDMLEHGEQGFLVPDGDPAAAVPFVERLLTDPALRREMGAAGRRRFEQQYTVEAYRAGLDRVFSRVAALSGGR